MKTILTAVFAVMIGLSFAGSTFAADAAPAAGTKKEETTKTETKTETKADGTKTEKTTKKKSDKKEEKKEEKH